MISEAMIICLVCFVILGIFMLFYYLDTYSYCKQSGGNNSTIYYYDCMKNYGFNVEPQPYKPLFPRHYNQSSD